MGRSASQAPRRRRVVVISPMAALSSPSTAGGVLLSRIVESHLEVGAEVTVLTPSMRAALAELDRTSEIATTLYLGRPRDHSGPRRLVLTLAHRITPVVQRRDPHLPWPPLVADLLTSPEILRLLRTADVIDLQWEEYGRLAGLLRRLAPRAALLCTFHDVTSQRLEREVDRASTDSGPGRARGGPAAREVDRARRTERKVAAALHRAFVLSEKDAHLLRSSAPEAPISVVSPPLVAPETPLVDAASRPAIVGFVSYLRRHENRDAALRLAEEIWPTVRASVPEARLMIIGGGLESTPARRLSAVAGVELTGFVDDLEDAYAMLRVTVSPIDRGAGVKFKVVESIVRGLPTITTTVGAEGIDPSLFTAVSDSNDSLAESTIAALLDRDVARAAQESARAARARYGIEQFLDQYQCAVGDAVSTAATTRRARRRGRR